MPVEQIHKIRRKRAQPAVVERALAQNNQLSFGARGLMLYLLSKPEGWEVRFVDLLKASPAKRTALRALIRELIAAGYARRFKQRDDKGRYKWVTEYSDEPQPVLSLLEKGAFAPDEEEAAPAAPAEAAEDRLASPEEISQILANHKKKRA